MNDPASPTPATFRELIEFNAPVATWFHCGGKADALARPATVEELRDLLLAFACKPVRILGDGANLLVADEGVDGLVVSLEKMDGVEFDEAAPGAGPAVLGKTSEPHAARRKTQAVVIAQAGAKLPQLITECVRRGLAGLETLGGIPASVGGAAVMNAGGSFGQISDCVHAVQGLTRFGERVRVPREEINYSYRHSGLGHLVVTAVEFSLRKVSAEEPPALREKLKEVMAYKKNSQPMAAHSAGCCFKNPGSDASGRQSAGKLIDLAGCKGLRIGGAEVSTQHANFVVAHPGCTATDVIAVMEEVERRVLEHSGIKLEREVVVWRREG
ncbi:MAG TPA: FAD-binding protein [Phycisphaerales bacterium]|nr:FAD-binding protein [Phycisphaerales bacterium]